MPSAARSVADRLVLFSADVMHRRGAFPDLDGVVLDPAGLRQDLLVLELMAPDLGAVVVEDHAPRAGGALVDGGDELGQLAAPLLTATPVVHHGLQRSRWRHRSQCRDIDIDRMPRGGPDASCVDRLLQTDRLEYLDRDDVDDEGQAQRDPGAGVDGRGLRQHREVRAHRARRGGRRARPQDPRARLGPRRAVAQAARMASHRRAHGHRRRAAIGAGDRRQATSASIRGRRCARWTPRRSTRPTGISTWRCSRCRFITYRRRWRRGCSPKAPGWPPSC